MASRETTPTPPAQNKEQSKETPKPATKETKQVEEAPKDTAKKSEAAATKDPAPKDSKKEEAGAKSAEAAKNKEETGKDDSKTTEPQENGDAAETPKGPNLREQFRAFSKFGDTKSDGKLLTLSQSDKWMKQAKVIDGKTITTTDTAITFKKFKQMKLGYPDYEKYLGELAKYKKQDPKAIKDKMRGCGTPGTRGTTSVVKGGAFDRLTDTQKYTGSHRQRFDPEGKGKGAAGRKDLPEKSGYVSGYKNKDTYSKTH